MYKPNSPNTSYILAHLCRISALELAQLRVTLNLEEHFLARRCHYLYRQNAGQVTKCAPQRARSTGGTHLDIDSIWVLSFNFVLSLRGYLLLLVRHI